MEKCISVQPIPYQGSKRSLAPRICAFFPHKVDRLYEPFAGSAALSVFAAKHNLARHFILGDSFEPLIKLWELVIFRPDYVARRYSYLWQEQFFLGHDHFNIVRARFNSEQDPIDFLYLVARCVKNAVRFNKEGKFTQSQDKRRHGMSPSKMEHSLHYCSQLLKGKVDLFVGDFKDCISAASPNDLVYLDPPYQGTTLGQDKRYANQLDRTILLKSLTELNSKFVPFILSYDGNTGGKTYGPALPQDLECLHMQLNAGVSSQSTLNGKMEITTESLYISKTIRLQQLYFSQIIPDRTQLFSNPITQ